MNRLGVSYCVQDTTHIPDLILNVDVCEMILAKKKNGPVTWQYDTLFSAMFVHSCRP